ncbi:MAG: helix-turn-helix transcriptional regulator [Bacillota bacterium]
MIQKFLSDLEVAKRYGVHRGSIWRWVQEKKIPQPVKLSSGCTRWEIEDLELWEKKLKNVESVI